MSESKKRLRKAVILREKQKGLCCYCEKPMRPMPHDPRAPVRHDNETLEHLNRRADGGAKWDFDNLALACFECNTGRGSVDWLTYKTYRMGDLFCEEIR